MTNGIVYLNRQQSQPLNDSSDGFPAQHLFNVATHKIFGNLLSFKRLQDLNGKNIEGGTLY